MVKFTSKMRNELNRKKHQISDFFDFSSYGHFCSKNCQFSINKNWKIDFSFNSAHCASFMKVGSKLRGGGLHIHSWDRAMYIYMHVIWSKLYTITYEQLYSCITISLRLQFLLFFNRLITNQVIDLWTSNWSNK